MFPRNTENLTTEHGFFDFGGLLAKIRGSVNNQMVLRAIPPDFVY
jgi:hypothetical protein